MIKTYHADRNHTNLKKIQLLNYLHFWSINDFLCCDFWYDRFFSHSVIYFLFHNIFFYSVQQCDFFQYEISFFLEFSILKKMKRKNIFFCTKRFYKNQGVWKKIKKAQKNWRRAKKKFSYNFGFFSWKDFEYFLVDFGLKEL